MAGMQSIATSEWTAPSARLETELFDGRLLKSSPTGFSSTSASSKRTEPAQRRCDD